MVRSITHLGDKSRHHRAHVQLSDCQTLNLRDKGNDRIPPQINYRTDRFQLFQCLFWNLIAKHFVRRASGHWLNILDFIFSYEYKHNVYFVLNVLGVLLAVQYNGILGGLKQEIKQNIPLSAIFMCDEHIIITQHDTFTPHNHVCNNLCNFCDKEIYFCAFHTPQKNTYVQGAPVKKCSLVWRAPISLRNIFSGTPGILEYLFTSEYSQAKN